MRPPFLAAAPCAAGLRFLLLVVLATSWLGLSVHAEVPPYLHSSKRVMFLGDSITNAGEYIVQIEAQLQQLDPPPEVINLGLPSETCSGLSEPAHPFPRPNVHERLDRALKIVQPDVVVACYGMNDAIYYPLDESRFEAYREGVTRLVAKCRAAGAKVILLTPPPFDPLPLERNGKLLSAEHEKFDWRTPYENYDQVIEKYAEWILTQEEQVDEVIDVFHPIQEYVAAKRQDDPEFTLSNDGVHLNEEGHRALANAILKHYHTDPLPASPELLELLRKRQQIMHAAWLTEVGHKRPGVKAGLPLKEARTSTEDLTEQIEHLRANRE